ncbi:unnamed protein product [Lota lota]
MLELEFRTILLAAPMVELRPQAAHCDALILSALPRFPPLDHVTLREEKVEPAYGRLWSGNVHEGRENLWDTTASRVSVGIRWIKASIA